MIKSIFGTNRSFNIKELGLNNEIPEYYTVIK